MDYPAPLEILMLPAVNDGGIRGVYQYDGRVARIVVDDSAISLLHELVHYLEDDAKVILTEEQVEKLAQAAYRFLNYNRELAVLMALMI